MSTALYTNSEAFTSRVLPGQPANLIVSDEDKENQSAVRERSWNGRVITINRTFCQNTSLSSKPIEADFVSVQFSPSSRSGNLPRTIYVRTLEFSDWKNGDPVKFTKTEGSSQLLMVKNLNDQLPNYTYHHVGTSSGDSTPIFS